MCYWQKSTRNGYINVPTNSAFSVLDLHRIQNLLLEELILVSRFFTMTRGALRNLTSSGFCATSHPGNSQQSRSEARLDLSSVGLRKTYGRVFHACFTRASLCSCASV